MKFENVLDLMIAKKCSDAFIRVNSDIRARIFTEVKSISEQVLTSKDVNEMVNHIMTVKDKEKLRIDRACEFALYYQEFWRFRVSVFYQRDTPALVIRKIDLRIPTFDELSLPVKVLEDFCKKRRGMVILTGITGSGKSTTIASMIQYINNNFGRHILTIEEPIEFTFKDNLSVINQRELGRDVESYQDALRQFALHSPDVIYIGCIRDAETCKAALTAAETGVFVFSTMHTVNATSTVERILNFFPPHEQNAIIDQLAYLLKGVLSQRLIPRSNKTGIIPAYESMITSPTISRLIREKKFWEISKYIDAGDIYGMKTFHKCLLDLVVAEQITPEDALEYADKKEEFIMELRNRGLNNKKES